jgi:hypothetical protein
MTVVAATDYYEALRLGPVALPVVEHLRRAAELPRQQPDEATPEWIEGVRQEINDAPRAARPFTYETGRTIEQEIRAEAQRGLETGGLLFSLYPPRPDGLHVVYATGPARNSRHTRNTVKIGTIAAIEADLPDFIRRQNMSCVGTFHTHPDFDAEPSATDRRSWASMLTRRSPYFVGVMRPAIGTGTAGRCRSCTDGSPTATRTGQP